MVAKLTSLKEKYMKKLLVKLLAMFIRDKQKRKEFRYKMLRGKESRHFELFPESCTSKKSPEVVRQEASNKWHRRSAGVILFKSHW